MISVTKALKEIDQNGIAKKKSKIAIADALNLVLAENVFSPINMPSFKQSSMDGYAFIQSEEHVFVLKGEVQAGNGTNISLRKGEAIRIFTGARVPDDADTVVMQEHTTVNEDVLRIEKMPNFGANVRPVGEQIKKGQIALEKGAVLNEAAIGFLAGLGVAEVVVFMPPKVGVLITGNELKEVGEKLNDGEVYDSNSITLKLALQKIGIDEAQFFKVKDSLKATAEIVEKALKTCDVLLISGGISVGDYDFVKQALEENQVEEIFYKVNQKPGKPLWFGAKGEKRVFALPGNPASSLSCFYVYVLPLLRASLGFQDNYLRRKKAIAAAEIINVHGKTLFLKGNVLNGIARQLKGQASSMLKSFAVSNALLIVPDNVEKIKEGEEINYIELL
jgi:molybdopterin molybdotransferase